VSKTAHNKRVYDAHIILKMNYRVRSIVFAAGWLCPPPRENEFVDSGVGHAFTSGKNNGVNPLNVIYRKECQEKKISTYEQDGVRALRFGRTFVLRSAADLRRSGTRLVKQGLNVSEIFLCSGCVFYASI
jgi:hypothetical protein